MRVTIAAAACLLALVRADAAFAVEGSGRPLPALQCAEPARLGELVSFSDARSAVGGIGITVSVSEQAAAVAAPAPAHGHHSRAEVPPVEEGSLLWCVSPDDPRCSPIDHSSSSGISIAQAKLGCAFDWSLGVTPPLPSTAPAGTSEYLGSVRDGVLGRLERPPRSAAV